MIDTTYNITYYASTTKYYRNNRRVTKYSVFVLPNLYETTGDKDCLEDLGKQMHEFYSENRDRIRLFNGKPWPQEGQRPLTRKEKKIFLNALVGNTNGSSSLSKFIDFFKVHYLSHKHKAIECKDTDFSLKTDDRTSLENSLN